MGMHTLPLLDKNQALFDWVDHPSSYNALKPGTPTTEFHRTAWNWLAFTLEAALSNAGLEWDAKYTDYSNAMIHEEDKRLTARKFNSVAWNVDRLFPVVWEWAENPEHRGYMGRLEFHGRSEYGRECDKVYPEYILELVEKVNFLIELMRGTWPTCQSGGTLLASVRIKAAGASNRALVSPINLLAQVPLYGGGIAAKGVTMNGQMLTGVEVQTGAQALLCLPSGADSRSYSSHNIRGNILPGALSEAGCQVLSTETAKADKYQSMISAAQVLQVVNSSAGLESDRIAFGDAQHIAALLELADVDGHPAGIMDADYLVRSLELARPQAGPALAGSGDYLASSRKISKLDKGRSASGIGRHLASRKYSAAADRNPAAVMAGRWLTPIAIEPNAAIHPLLETQTLYRAPVGQKAESEKLLALMTSAGGLALSDNTAEAEIQPSKAATAQLFGSSRILAQGHTKSIGLATGCRKKTASRIRCVIECLTPEPTWYDPVQNGSDLYIRSVWSSYQDRSKLFIDVGEWYEPIQEGSNLHIRSAYSVWTDGSSANIDTAFFLEPVQEGSNLHIRMDIFGGE